MRNTRKPRCRGVAGDEEASGADGFRNGDIPGIVDVERRDDGPWWKGYVKPPGVDRSRVMTARQKDW